MKKYPKRSIVLYNGGTLYINQLGGLWTIDVFDMDSALTDDPSYHAAYDNEADCLADAGLWKTWDDMADEIIEECAE